MEPTANQNANRPDAGQEKERISSASDEPGKERRIFFETKSLAEVYAQQGHTTTALEIYQRIHKKNPSDQEIEKRILQLEARRFPKRNIKVEKPEE